MKEEVFMEYQAPDASVFQIVSESICASSVYIHSSTIDYIENSGKDDNDWE